MRLGVSGVLVADLLTGFVGEDWVHAVDLDTLDKCNGSYVSDDLRDRQDDIVWRVRRGDEVAYVYLLLECWGPFGLSLSKPCRALRQAQRERWSRCERWSQREQCSQRRTIRFRTCSRSRPHLILIR